MEVVMQISSIMFSPIIICGVSVSWHATYFSIVEVVLNKLKVTLVSLLPCATPSIDSQIITSL
jgi:hypothetical protein